MTNLLSRLLLAASSAILLFGGAVHTLAFKKAVAAIAASNLAPFFGKALKALWLIDSTMLITTALIFGLVAVRPAMVSRVFVVLVSLSPALTAILLYSFIGAIMPAHLLVIASALAVSAAFLPAHT
jgi:hypothetical protein